MIQKLSIARKNVDHYDLKIGYDHLYVYTRVIKNISNKMREDVWMLKPKKHANKFGRLT